jgi:tetratricopeptide (TPR) repeat protein
LIALGKYEETEILLRESLMLSQTTDDRYGMAMALHHLGLVAMKRQDAVEAVYLFREALVLLRTIGGWEVAQTLNDLAGALWSTGARREAEDAYQEALAAALRAHALPDALQALTGLAVVLQHRGRSAEALGLAVRALIDPASRIETRRQAEAIRDAARSVLSAEQIDAVEGRTVGEPLEVSLAALAALDPSRSG